MLNVEVLTKMAGIKLCWHLLKRLMNVQNILKNIDTTILPSIKIIESPTSNKYLCD